MKIRSLFYLFSLVLTSIALPVVAIKRPLRGSAAKQAKEEALRKKRAKRLELVRKITPPMPEEAVSGNTYEPIKHSRSLPILLDAIEEDKQNQISESLSTLLEAGLIKNEAEEANGAHYNLHLTPEELQNFEQLVEAHKASGRFLL